MNFSAIVEAIKGVTYGIAKYVLSPAFNYTMEAFHQLAMAAPMILNAKAVSKSPQLDKGELISNQIKAFDEKIKEGQNEWGMYSNPLEQSVFNMVHKGNESFLASMDQLLADGKMTKKEFLDTFHKNLNERIENAITDNDAQDIAHFISNNNMNFSEELKKVELKLHKAMGASIKNEQIRDLYSDVVTNFVGEYRSSMDRFFGPDGSVKSVREDWENFSDKEMDDIHAEANVMNKQRDAAQRMNKAAEQDKDDISLGM